MKGVKIERAIPKLGSKFSRNWQGITYEMTIVSEEGIIQYKVNDKLFKSPTAAAKHITKQEVNGWRFWKVKD